MKEFDQSFKLTGLFKKTVFESPSGLKAKIFENYEESMEKIENLYKKNDMAIRDYIKIKDSLNFCYLVRYLYAFPQIFFENPIYKNIIKS